MKVGDLVKGRGSSPIMASLSLGGTVGIVLKVVTDDPIVGDRHLLIQWNGGVLDTINERLLEVVNESR